MMHLWQSFTSKGFQVYEEVYLHLSGLEETSIVEKDILDSMDVHIAEGKKEQSNAIRELKERKGNKIEFLCS